MALIRKSMKRALSGNSYPGRGIVIGKSSDGRKAMFAYFIMGRSENSRNRVFVEKDDEVVIYPFDESKVEDPSLIIYSPIKQVGSDVIVTNGDQTDTIYDFVREGRSFAEALATREFEPDSPNFTPRISAMLTLGTADFSYEMSILKSIDGEGSGCARYTYSYPATCGLGHFIHTYEHDGSPLPTFQGEPRRVSIPDDIDEFTADIWNNLNEEKRISLYVRYIDLQSGKTQSRLINKNK